MAFAGVLRQSTAVDVLIGPFLDEDDGKTAEGSLTLSASDVGLSKNGQGFAAKNDATACALDEGTPGGYYNCEFDTTDTNTCGVLTVAVHESGALPVRFDFQVVTQATYDALFASSAAGPVVRSAHAPSAMSDSLGQVSGAYTDVATRNAAYHTVQDEGAGMSLSYLFNTVLAALTPVALEVTGRYYGEAGTTVHVYAYNYLTAAWEQLSDDATAFTHNDTDQTRRFDLDAAHRNDGAAEIRCTSDTATSGDALRLDQVKLVAATGEPARTQAGIADAVGALSSIVAAATIAADWTDGGRLDVILDALATKTGYKLASDGLDSISTTEPSGVAANFREMVVQTWRRFFKKARKTSSAVETYKDDGTTVATTQAITTGDPEEIGAAS